MSQKESKGTTGYAVLRQLQLVLQLSSWNVFLLFNVLYLIWVGSVAKKKRVDLFLVLRFLPTSSFWWDKLLIYCRRILHFNDRRKKVN